MGEEAAHPLAHARCPHVDWDPLAPDNDTDPQALLDGLRQHDMVFSEAWGWSLVAHADVVRVIEDHETFSSIVSNHLNVPNGMDPPEHAIFRNLLLPFFSSEAIERFAPKCREVARDAVAQLVAAKEADVAHEFGEEFALRMQCAFLGWPEEVQAGLRGWMRRNQEASRLRDREAARRVAAEFAELVRACLAELNPQLQSTVMECLVSQRVEGRLLHEEEIVSIVRNWTAGELGTISASVGIILHALASGQKLQATLREAPEARPRALEEILRQHGPLLMNRRVAKRRVVLGGRTLEAGEKVSILWPGANRDPRVFPNPTEIELDRDQAQSLLYGRGIHVCPGAPLARLELASFLDEVLAQTKGIALAEGEAPQKAKFPACGYRSLRLRLDARQT